ncbi:DUF3060 domain-containing protein [Mycolicibacterium vaccae]|uniref:DUF3060 domain-containing protein n=1 Tax=Mycolicibacterium vaccae TaxID=1810 RepID=UPI003CFDE8A6
MEPDADPEARIRDLERALVDRARASELQMSPYYAPPQRVVRKKSSSTATWLVPLAIGVAAVTATIGSVVYFSTSSLNSPGIAGGGGPIDGPGPPVPPVPLDPAEEVVTVTVGGTANLSGVDTRRVVRCDGGGTVSVSGVDNVVEVTGPCTSVSVSGVRNVLTVESAMSIRASGFDNRVTFGGGDPEVVSSGTGNVVEQG